MKYKNKGFTLVELLCIIAILGVLAATSVIAVTKLVNTSKTDEKYVQEQLLIKTCESYIQDHKEEEPKAINESKNLMISKLYEKKYLKDKVINSSGESCMENSYIRMYRLSNEEVVYVPFLYCGKDEVPNYEEVIEPKVNIHFINNSNNNKIFENLDNAYLYIDISGGTTKGGLPIAIDTYYFTISTKDSSGKIIDLYDSGEISAYKKNSLSEEKKILEYVNKEDILKTKYISVTFTAINTIGGEKEVTVVSE